MLIVVALFESDDLHGFAALAHREASAQDEVVDDGVW